MKTATDLAALTRQKTWDKDVVLWVGSEHALLHTLGQIAYAVLDLLDLFDLDIAPEEREQAQRLVETLYLWGISLPENLRDGLTAQEVAEAAWLSDDAVGATAQAEHLLDKLVQGGFPMRVEKKTRDGREVAIYAYEVSAAQESPVKYFAPLKKMAKQDLKGQESTWMESLFWQLPDMTPEAQQELGIDGGILGSFQPPDQRSPRDRQEGKPPAYAFPHRTGASTRRVHKVSYSGEVVVCERWREEFGKEIDNPDQHFRLVYLTSHPGLDDTKIAADLKDARIAVMRPEALCEDTREALADLMAAEQMKRNCSAPNQHTLREYADGKRREALKVVLKCQQDEYRRGKVITQKGYGIPAIEIFKSTQRREDDLASRLLEKAYDTPLFSSWDLRRELTDADARKVFAGLFHKEPARAEKDAVHNFATGLELVIKSHPADFNATSSQALAKVREQVAGRSDLPVSDVKAALCSPPYGLTESMVMLYVFALLKSGGFELALNPNAGVTLSNGRPLPGDRLTAHTLPLCEWNARLDRALLGSRLVASLHKGWNEVLPYARVLDPGLKPAATPDEEQTRNESLLATLAQLQSEIPEVENSLVELAGVLSGSLPTNLKEVLARYRGLVTATSYQEFDAHAARWTIYLANSGDHYMAAPRFEVADVIVQYCAQLGEMGIRVERALLFGSYARGAEREGSDIDVLIVSSDFSALNARERLEHLGTAAARLWQPIEALACTPDELAHAEPATLLEEIVRTGVRVA